MTEDFKMKKFLALLMTIFLLVFCTGCGGNSQNAVKKDSSEKTVGVILPNKIFKRWIMDGDNIKKGLEAEGYKVDVKYSENDIPIQIEQIEEMIDNDVDCLVITAVDSTKLVDVLAKAKAKNIPVISYDRLLMDTDAVSYYATFDNKGVGLLIGKYVEDKFGLKEGKGPYNVEFFAGSADDNNAHFLHAGLFEVLQPYIDNGQLIVPSGQTDFDVISIFRWSQETAQNRMNYLLSTYYVNDRKIDAVISPSDRFAYSITDELEKHGYKVGENWPLITGQDAEPDAIKNIIDDRQSMTVFKDTRVLAEKCVTMVKAVLEGKEPDVNDTTFYDNRKLVVPAYLCTPIAIDKNNYKKELVDSGYYTEDALNKK